MNQLTFKVAGDPESVLKTILYCKIHLTKSEMIEALGKESVFIHDNYYKVPEQTLLHCLINGQFGETNLELEMIK